MDPSPDTAADLESLLRRWRSAESKLYPMIVVNPHQYETNLRLVRAMTDQISHLATVEELIEAYGGRSSMAASTAHGLSLAAPQPEVEGLLVDAAFHARYRALRSELEKAEVDRRIAAAGDGPGWVVLAETGADGATPAPGFRRVEMHLPDGKGLHTYVDLDPSTYGPRYGFEVLRLDPSNGGELPDDAIASRQEFSELTDWERAISEARQEIGAT